MEETGTLEKTNLLDSLLPDGEPGPNFAPYVGGKTSHLQWLLPLLPQTHTYVEPYSGCLSVLLNKEPCKHEVINDADAALVNLYQVLRSPRTCRDLAAALALTPFARTEYLRSIDVPKGAGKVERARALLNTLSKARQSARCRPCGANFSHALTSRNKNLFGRLGHLDNLPEVLLRLRRVVIESMDALALISQHDHKDALIYCDPPYLFSTRGKSALYRHEAGDDAHHIALAKVLYRCKAMVAISGYESPLYRKLFKGWKIHRAPVRVNGGKESQECLWTNY
jgi:DNA adenine methylase